MITAIQYIAVFIALFGPKFGVLDVRLLLVPLMLFISANPKFNIKIGFQTILTFFLICYSMLLFVIYPPDMEFLRYVRSFVSLITVPFFLQLNGTSMKKALKIFLGVLLIHPISIYLSLLSPDLQVFLADLYQCGRSDLKFRSNGLTAGFDISGYLSIAGFLICFYLFDATSERKYLFYLLFFYISGFFTSRVNMLMLLCLPMYFGAAKVYRSKLNLQKIVIVAGALVSLSLAAYKYAVPLLASTIDLEMLEGVAETAADEEALSSYAKTDPIEMVKSFVILPKSFIGMFFGENFFPKSDSGYIQTINAIGILGLIISFIFYITYIVNLNSIIRKSKDVLIKQMSVSLRVIVLITIFVCFKNQYFFTRGSFELILVLFCIIWMGFKEERELKQNG